MKSYLPQQDLEAKPEFRSGSYRSLVKIWKSIIKILQLLQQYDNVTLINLTLKQMPLDKR